MSEVKTDSLVNVSGDNDSGIDLSTNDVVAIKTADSERARVDASGNVGVGTSSPTGDGATIHINGSTANSTLHLTNSTTGSGATDGTYVTTSGNDFLLRNREAGNTLFYTNNSERMRIDSSGRVFLSKSSAGDFTSGFEWQGNNGALVLYRNTGVTLLVGRSNNGEAIRFNRGTSDVGSIDLGTSSTSYNTSSDHRLKENVIDMTGAIDRVKALAPKRFNFIADADTTVDGFLAHEAQSVVPEAVTGTHNEVDDDGNAVMQGIDQAKLVPLLTGALQEAIAKIEALETRVTALENA